MATQSIIRNGMTSPVRTMLKTTGSSRSILKRPVALPLSPVYASFSVLAQVSPHLKSVQFLPSPSLVSTFTTHSAASYDRAPITVSPLERTYVTSLEGFKLSAPPKPFRSTARAQHSPAITDFEDPRSPKAQPASKQVDDSPSHRARSSSLDLPKRNKKGLTLTSSTVIPAAPTPSSLGRFVFSPTASSLNRGKKPAPLDLEFQLSQDFWQSLSLEEAEETGDETMVTALEYPESAVEYEGKMDLDTHISQPQVMYASADGVLWSPGMPQPATRKDFTAPSPNDPFATFPSFTAAIEMGSLTYPPRVALECGI